MSNRSRRKGSILVTGGAGFIGSHLVERLLQEGFDVEVIDDCSTGRTSNLRAVAGHSALRLHLTKISDCPELKKILAKSQFVYHLAAAVGVELVIKAPVRTIETNLHETEVLLEAASERQTPVLLTSTSEVYGKSNARQFSEEDDLLIGPPHLLRWSYACSKLMDEFLALAYAKERGLPVIITRLFNTVGPRQTGRYGMVLPRFIEAAQAGKPLTVYGTGRQKRCFCYVTDTVEALFRLQKRREAYGQIFNVGSNEEISIQDLARQVVKTLNSTSPIRRLNYAKAYEPGFEDMQRRKPDISRIRRLTGFEPGTSLLEIIKRTAAWREAE